MHAIISDYLLLMLKDDLIGRTDSHRIRDVKESSDKMKIINLSIDYIMDTVGNYTYKKMVFPFYFSNLEFMEDEVTVFLKPLSELFSNLTTGKTVLETIEEQKKLIEGIKIPKVKVPFSVIKNFIKHKYTLNKTFKVDIVCEVQGKSWYFSLDEFSVDRYSDRQRLSVAIHFKNYKNYQDRIKDLENSLISVSSEEQAEIFKKIEEYKYQNDLASSVRDLIYKILNLEKQGGQFFSKDLGKNLFEEEALSKLNWWLEEYNETISSIEELPEICDKLIQDLNNPQKIRAKLPELKEIATTIMELEKI